MTITGIAHSAVCVPDVDEAARWYSEALGFSILSPPFLMEGEAIKRDMGELIPIPRLKAAIVGLPGDGDRVLELIEYPGANRQPRSPDASIVDEGLTHVGLVCDDIVADARRTRVTRCAVPDPRHCDDRRPADDLVHRSLRHRLHPDAERAHPDRPYFAQY